MGQKHSSSSQKHRLRSSHSRQEFTEVVDFEFSDVSDPKFERKESNEGKISTEKLDSSVIYPDELLKVVQHIQEIESQIPLLSDQEIDLYFATLKDDLHNNWEKVYGIKDATPQVKMKKTETIERIKALLKGLNERFLKRQL